MMVIMALVTTLMTAPALELIYPSKVRAVEAGGRVSDQPVPMRATAVPRAN
jgi:hypothetical protein